MDKILVTGGAYYLNMNSNGKQLKMKQGKGLEVEFPKLTENEMGLFLGERDSLGQINWTSTNETFKQKDTQVASDYESQNPAEPTKPIKASEKNNRVLSVIFEDSLMLPELQHYNNVSFRVNDDCEFNPEDSNNYWYNVEISKSKADGEYIIVFYGFNQKRERLKKIYEVTPVFEGEDHNMALKEYEDKYNEYLKRKAEIQRQYAVIEGQNAVIEFQRKTYEAVELMNLGWINCDRFLYDPNPKTDIQLIVNNDFIEGARIYAVFKDIRAIVSEQYCKGQKVASAFRNIPTGRELTIIALGIKDETPYYFETTINTETDRQVNINFVVTTQEDIKEKMKRMN
ncbi:MAG: hypothetical protein M3Q97_02770 [Bacteroidota bacterium]|nr:hypothetical protein [Bacteroidota bacterium]